MDWNTLDTTKTPNLWLKSHNNLSMAQQLPRKPYLFIASNEVKKDLDVGRLQRRNNGWQEHLQKREGKYWLICNYTLQK